jgi:hexosaminidase
MEIMAMHKLNVLHLHLVDDPGWRLQIDKYPELTEKGGFRGKGAQRYGGYYTKDEIRDMVKYAADLHIEIVPEIELPAHCQSALAAYPSLGCNDKQFDMPTKCYISPEILCAGKESTYTFLEDVMTEVAELFPGKFVHVGGDEAKYDRWKKCQHCKKRMQQEGIDSFQQLQGYMTRRIEKFLMKKGKRLIGWDEILDCGLAPNATVMTWHRPQTAVQAAKSGNNVVMALTGHAYFDAPESNLPGEPPAATWLTPISLRKAYQWEPAPVVLNDREKKFILGAHGCLWSDRFMHDPILQDIGILNENRSYKYVEYLSLPRMAALAEVVWTKQDQRSWEDFTARQSIQYNRYTAAGYHYRVPLPIVEKKPKSDGTFLVTITSPVKDGTLYYTIDGTYPDVYSEIYTKPIIVNDLDKFSAVTSVNRRHYSLAFKFPQDTAKKFAGSGVELGKWQSGNISAGTYKPLELDATGKINKNGMYELTFMYTHGLQRLDIEKVEVIVNGKVVAADEHYGTTGVRHQNNVYMLKITDFETGANYTVRARIMGDTGNDSNGQVFLLLKDEN